MIPKTVHCCWLGGGPRDALSERCRASWAKHASGFAVREWDMRAVEASGVAVPPFVREALAKRKWAFAADWVRFLALYLEGGVYFDYDFELLSPIDDLLSGGPFVAGQWMPDGSVGLEPAIVALEKGSPLAKAMLDHYATAAFDGLTTVGEVLAEKAKAEGGGERDGLRVLSPKVFSPIDVRGVCHRTDETRGIHHYAMSWAPPGRRIAKWLAWHGMRGLVEALLSVWRKWDAFL